MRINNNMMAMNTHRQLGVANNDGAKSMEKLSSGMRINRAGDDAAGLAISEKMRGQIRGLNQASSNAQDGISLIQTAEGALNETHAILQRMRELAVQSSTDTNTDADRVNIQDEINELTAEITRIAETTEFNTMSLLDGSFGDKKFHIGANASQNITLDVSDMGSEALNLLGIAGNSGQLKAALGVDVIDTTGKLEELSFTDGDATGGKVVVTGSIEKGDLSFKVDEDVLMKDLVAELEKAGLKVEIDADKYNGGTAVGKVTTSFGTTGKVSLERLQEFESIDYQEASVTLKGDVTSKIDIKDHTGDLKSFEAKEGDELSATFDRKTGKLELTLKTGADNTVADIKKAIEDAFGGDVLLADITVGAKIDLTNASLTTDAEFKIDETATKGVKVDKKANLDVSTQAAADKAITTVNDALERVSQQRSKLGAVQNRLEHTIKNLDTSSENLQASESRIRDVDMAKEMMEQTKANILAQASTAMLAQASQSPQSVLQLLG